MFKKILVANRAYFASRAIHTIKSMGIKVVSVYAKEDSNLYYTKEADEAYLIEANYNNPYIDPNTILELAIKTNCDAILIAKSALAYDIKFLKTCEEHKITVLGTNLDFTVVSKDKLYIKNFAKSLDIKVVNSSCLSYDNIEAIYEYFNKTKKPIFIKPNFSYNSIGVKYIENEANIEKSYIAYRKEIKGILKDTSFIIEDAYLNSKLVKLIALRDNFNNTNIFGTIDASINNNYKNIIAETCLNIDAKLESYITNAVKLLCENLNLRGYSEFKFLIDNKNAYLLGINPMLSEHYSIFELAYNIDIIKQIILINLNNKLEIAGKTLKPRSYIIQAKVLSKEANLYVDTFYIPTYLNTYNEVNIKENFLVPTFYDDLLFKISGTARSKLEAVSKLRLLIDNTVMDFDKTNQSELINILKNPSFLNNSYNLKFNFENIIDKNELAIDFYNNNDNNSLINILSGGQMQKTTLEKEKLYRRSLKETYTSKQKELISKIPGKVLQVLVNENAKVEEGQVLLILEAMKMENRIYAPKTGIIEKIYVNENQNIMTGAKLVSYK